MVYFILSYLQIPDRVTNSTSVAIIILISGLTKYYSSIEYDISETHSGHHLLRDSQNKHIDSRKENVNNTGLSVIFFVSVFTFLLIISYTSSSQDIRIFDSWSNFGAINII